MSLTYQVYVVADSSCESELRYDFGAKTRSLEECSSVASQLLHRAVALQEQCADMDEEAYNQHVLNIHPAVANYEGSLVCARRSDGVHFMQYDEDHWEIRT